LKKILLILSSLLLTNFTYACKCRNSTFEEQVDWNNFIFVGKIIEATNQESHIKVIYEWKGELNDTIVLKNYTTSCHKLKLEKNKEYLIYFRNKSKGVSICSRTMKLKYSQDILKLHHLFMTANSKEKTRQLKIHNQYFKSILDYSEVKNFKNTNSTFFLYEDYHKGLLIMNLNEFIQYNHQGSIPKIQKINYNLKSIDNKFDFYTFYYWFEKNEKHHKKLLRKYRRYKKSLK